MFLSDKQIIENITRLANAAFAGGVIKTATDAQNVLHTLGSLQQRLKQPTAPPAAMPGMVADGSPE